MDRPRRQRGFLLSGAVLGGLLAGASLPPRGWPWLLWPALACLWAITARGGPAGGETALTAGEPDRPAALRHPAAAAGLLWGMSAVAVSHRWLLGLHPLDWIGVPAPLSLPLCLLLLALCSLLGGLLVMGWGFLMHHLDPRRWSTGVIGASLWGLAEVVLARGPLFWIGLGASALPADLPLAGLARLGGAGLAAAAQVLIGWSLWWSLNRLQPSRCRCLLLPLLLAGLFHLAGAGVLAVPVAPAAAREKLLVVQPSIPTREKFGADQQRLLRRQLRQAQQRAASVGSEGDREVSSVLLPEGALALGQILPTTAAVEVLSGGFRWEAGELRSSLLRFPAGERRPAGWVDKFRLVPLGEWVPFADWWRWSGLSAVGGIEPGAASRLLQRPAGPIGVAICYEIADGTSLAASVRRGAGWLLASANLDPYPVLLQEQFEALARLRAIETGRWLVSSANTGPSLVVDGRGHRRDRLPSSRALQQDVEVEVLRGLTPYDRWGEIPLAGLLLAGTVWRLGPRLTPAGNGSEAPWRRGSSRSSGP